MLTIEGCRKFLSTGCSLTNTELETLRGQLYDFAHVSMCCLPQWGMLPVGLYSTST